MLDPLWDESCRDHERLVYGSVSSDDVMDPRNDIKDERVLISVDAHMGIYIIMNNILCSISIRKVVCLHIAVSCPIVRNHDPDELICIDKVSYHSDCFWNMYKMISWVIRTFDSERFFIFDWCGKSRIVVDPRCWFIIARIRCSPWCYIRFLCASFISIHGSWVPDSYVLNPLKPDCFMMIWLK
jgi:hypothetical protein